MKKLRIRCTALEWVDFRYHELFEKQGGPPGKVKTQITRRVVIIGLNAVPNRYPCPLLPALQPSCSLLVSIHDPNMTHRGRTSYAVALRKLRSFVRPLWSTGCRRCGERETSGNRSTCQLKYSSQDSVRHSIGDILRGIGKRLVVMTAMHD